MTSEWVDEIQAGLELLLLEHTVAELRILKYVPPLASGEGVGGEARAGISSSLLQGSPLVRGLTPRPPSLKGSSRFIT